ncbi:TPA: hypothetical protein ACTUT5_000684 [Legionella anisa]|uniref:hypothetical protein n=1 Tax=Legionella anisa TaxID=28082 RepID=UPI00197EFFE7|nr:hypothetical protein [Legionella anisa]MBN5935934.1 hypothetical protein [Legionella anisa]
MAPIFSFSFIVYFITSIFTITPANAEGRDLNEPYSKPKYVWHVTGTKSSGQYIAEDTHHVGTIPPVVGENVRSQGGAAFGDLNMDTNQYTYVDWVGGPYYTKDALSNGPTIYS